MSQHKKSIGFGKNGNISLVPDSKVISKEPENVHANFKEDLHEMLLGKSDEEMERLIDTLPMGNDGELLIFED